jgi:DNA-binding transcriptional ArsR family regulator
MRSELAFSADDLALTRFSVSPMWQVVTSFRLLATQARHPVHHAWADQVRPRITAAGLASGWLADLVQPAGYIPDFLTPLPRGLSSSLESELTLVRATPAGHVCADLDRLDGDSARRRALRADPDARLARLTAEIETYWQLALAPYWARIRALLDADVYHRTRQVAEYGAGHLFNDLHATVRWDDNTLQMVRRHCAISRESAGPGLVLIPSAFATHVLTWTRPPDPPQLSYPTRGVATLWEHRPVVRSAAIAAVLGRTRAGLLAELETPTSTTTLAQRTGLSAAGISQHLTALRDAGMVSTHRAGRSVLYARTAVADSLLCGPR